MSGGGGTKRRLDDRDLEKEMARTEKYLRKLERRDKKRGREGEQDEGRAEEVCEEWSGEQGGLVCWVNEEVVELKEYECDEEVEEGHSEVLDPNMVNRGRSEEVEFTVKKLDMFEFGTLEEAFDRSGGKKPTTTQWVEGWKEDEDGEMFVRCRFGGQGLQTEARRGQGGLTCCHAALEAKRLHF